MPDFNNMPKDRWLIQESLKYIAQGPQTFTNWVKENQQLFDPLFFNLLKKMVEFSKKSGNTSQAQTFEFLQRCFDKIFDLKEKIETIVITKDNYNSWLEKGCEYLHTNNVQAAIPIFEALGMYSEYRPSAPEILDGNLGISYAQLRNFPKAIEHFKKALQIVAEGSLSHAKILSNLGNVFMDAKKYPEAIVCHEDALKISQKLKNADLQIKHLNDLTTTYIEQNDLTNAINAQQQSLIMAKQTTNLKKQADCLTRLGVLYTMIGRVEEAKEICQRALELSQSGNSGEADG